MTKGFYPRELKEANIILLFKSGNTTCVNNYRQISILSVFSKVYEKIMFNILSEYLKMQNVLCSNQFGCREKHSSYMALITLVYQLSEALEKGVYSDAHCGHGFENHNTPGERIMEFTFANGLCVTNTSFKKGDRHLITYSSDGDSTRIYYILYRKSFNSAVNNVKLIPNEQWIKYHYMIMWLHASYPLWKETQVLTLHPNLDVQRYSYC